MKHEDLTQFEIESDAKRVLHLARELIDRDGWCQRMAYWENSDKSKIFRCAGRALVDAANELGIEDFEARQLFISAMGHPWCIPIWNDREGRTKADVLAAFDRALA